MIYILYGQPASGKTVLGKKLAEYLSTTHHIDGDEFRELFSNNNYSKNGREENIRAANAVATYLNKTQSYDVILTLVNPYKHLRDELKHNNPRQTIEILLTSTRDLRKEYHVEDFETGTPNAAINTDSEVEQTWRKLKAIIC